MSIKVNYWPKNMQLYRKKPTQGKVTSTSKRLVDSVKHKVTFKAIIKSTKDQSSTETKKILKEKLNPVKLKVGVDKLKGISNGAVIVECSSEDEVEILTRK